MVNISLTISYKSSEKDLGILLIIPLFILEQRSYKDTPLKGTLNDANSYTTTPNEKISHL